MKVPLSRQIILIMILSILVSLGVGLALTIYRTRVEMNQLTEDWDRSLAEVIARGLSEGDRMENFLGGSQYGDPSHRENQNFAEHEKELPSIVIATLEGQIFSLEGDRLEISPTILPRRLDKKGAPFYKDGELAGYVLSLGRDWGWGKRRILILLLMGTSAAFLASLVGWFLLKKSLRPIGKLHLGVGEIIQGNYAYRVSLDKRLFHDELSELGKGFNQMAEAIEVSQEWKKRIVSDTAHELRTPVSILQGNLEMILEGVYEADRTRIQSLLNQSQALGGLIEGLQLLSWEEGGQNPLVYEVLSLGNLLEEGEMAFRSLAEKKGIRLTLVETSDKLLWRGDRLRCQQVLNNILGNALKFTSPGGWVELRGGQEGEVSVLEVEDSGVGIPPELREKVFQRFFKADSSRGSEGSGLGLAISKTLMERQGARLEIQSGRQGGALLRLIFPPRPLPNGGTSLPAGIH